MKLQRHRPARKLFNRRFCRLMKHSGYRLIGFANLPLPAGAVPAVFCPSCGFIREGCTCAAKQRHQPGCRFLRAASLSIELACDHGFQACPICDPCTCNPKIEEAGIR